MKQAEISSQDQAALEEKLALARSAKAQVEVLSGPDPVEAILEFAKSRGVTQLFIGHSQRSGFRESFAFAGESVDRGYSVVIFPEGRRTTDGQMSPFRAGIGILAQAVKIPVVPMRIDGLFPLKQQDRTFARRGEIKITVGNPMEFQVGTSEEEIARKLEEIVKSL